MFDFSIPYEGGKDENSQEDRSLIRFFLIVTVKFIQWIFWFLLNLPEFTLFIIFMIFLKMAISKS